MAGRVMYIVRLYVRRYSSGLLDNTNTLPSMSEESFLFLTKRIELLYIMPHNPYNVPLQQYATRVNRTGAIGTKGTRLQPPPPKLYSYLSPETSHAPFALNKT